jgi:hypothetical protein
MQVRESYIPCLTISYYRPLLGVVCEIEKCFNDHGLFCGIPFQHLHGGTENNGRCDYVVSSPSPNPRNMKRRCLPVRRNRISSCSQLC